ncbi:MAG: cupin domain-containing protein [Gammaproteobacteria bacterium]|nr:cupin domain-containing protein [Gammaproteobacteria bacterium]
MNKDNHSTREMDTALSDEELLLLSSEPAALDTVDINSSRMQSLRARVMSQVDEQPLPDLGKLITVKTDDGDWQQLNDKISKKTLYIDEQKGQEAFLLRIKPGAEAEPHQHSSDEHCIVLEGSFSFGDLHLHAGDYHFAPKGSWHTKAHSVSGALLYIQTGIEQQVSL